MTSQKILTCGHPSPKVYAMISSLKELYQFIEVPLNYDFKSAFHRRKASLVVLFVPEKFQLALKKLQEIKKFRPHLPVIMVGPKVENVMLLEAFREGTADYVMEPFTSREISDAIEKTIQSDKGKKVYSSGFFTTLSQQLQRFFTRSSKHRLASHMPNTIGISGVPFPPQSEQLTKQVDLNVQFFGQFEMVFRGQEVVLLGTKTRSLLAYMLFHRDKPIRRDTLMEKFWPETSPSSARNSLNVAIHNIRKAFQKVDEGRDCILYNNERYGFCESLRIATDVDQFRQYWSHAKAKEQFNGIEGAISTYQKAYAFYRSDLLEDLLYEDWTSRHRDNLRETYLVILDRLGEYHFEQEQYAKVIELCKKMLLLDPCMEDVYERIIRAYHKSGNRGKAIRMFHKCVSVMREELNVEPSESILRLWEEIS